MSGMNVILCYFNIMEVGTLTPDTRVENEECVYCFNDFDSEEGVNICLKCFTCCCAEHAKLHFKEREHTMFLGRKRITTVSDKDPEKLAIGVDGGFEDVKYSYEYELRLFDENGYQVLPEELIEDNEEAISIVDRLKKGPNASDADQVQAWELNVVECPHVKNLDAAQAAEPVPAPHMKCHDCDKDKNLWLCLTCGYVGCGRRNYDGSGGNNHALDHAHTTHHPVVVKLGTISPDGRADLFCYECDETVCDSKIAQHLKKLSIDVQSAVKTESTTTELSVEINKSWDFEAVTADGREYPLMEGPYSVGLRNLGNTCYTNSVLQMLCRIPEFINEFQAPDASNARWNEPKRQFNRLITAMSEGKLPYVSPRILRSVVCRDSMQFMSTQQQDAVEFFLYLFNYLKVHNPNTSLNLAEFDEVQVLTCNKCKDAATIPLRDQHVLMLIPPHQAAGEPTLNVKMTDLLQMTLVNENPDRTCDKCNNHGSSVSTQFKNFPEYLFVSVMLDAVSETGMVRKMDIDVELDPDNLDLTPYRSQVEETIDEKKVAELLNFGFPRAQCVRALQNVGTVEQAVEWIMDHPMEQSPAVSQVMEMGFSEDEAREALEESQGNVALAIEWLFGPRQKKQSATKSDGKGVYELLGFVQHKGLSALCGHYVAVIRREGHWVLYNDRKVAVYPDDVKPDFGKGYLYLYKRKSE